ncbi:MAG: hypothetical protein ACYS17_13330 [Planctomycetota bacterium]|jgi:hypothetical protein
MESEKRNILAWLFIPRYNELALFLMSIAFILVFITHADLRTASYKPLLNDFDIKIIIALVLFVLGIIFSLYHVFTTREKTDGEKAVMLFFAIFVNGFSGIAAGMHILKEAHGILILFPIWNMINGALLLLMYRFEYIDESSIIDDNTTMFQVIFGSLVVVSILIVCRFVFKVYWAITFSICVTYASNVSGTIQSLFSGPRSRYEEENNTSETDL